MACFCFVFSFCVNNERSAFIASERSLLYQPCVISGYSQKEIPRISQMACLTLPP